MSCIGPMARCVEDLALLYKIIAGPDGRDTDVPPMPVDDVDPTELKNLRVAVAPNFPDFPLGADIRTAVTSLAQQLSDAGASVKEAALPELDFGEDIASTADLVMMLTGVNRSSEHPTTLGQYLSALHRRDQSIIAWERFFERWDVLLCPAAMTTAFPHCDTGSPLLVDGQDVSYWMVNAHTALFNYSGHPAIVLPCGLDRDGLPIGVQLVARRWDDSRLLAIASAVSTISGAFQPPPVY